MNNTQNVTVNGNVSVHAGYFDRYEGRVTATLCNSATFTTAGGYQVPRRFSPTGRPVTCPKCKSAVKRRDA